MERILAPKNMGEVVKLLAYRAGLRMSDLADAAGVSRQTLYDWNGDGKPSWEHVVAVARVLADALGVETGDILLDLERLDRETSDSGLSRSIRDWQAAPSLFWTGDVPR